MTEAGRQKLSVGWQTGLVVAATVVAGRWLAGGGFGYTLFAVIWAPLAAIYVVPSRFGWSKAAAIVVLAGLFSAVWWVGWPWLTALRLTGWLTLFIGTAVAIRTAFQAICFTPPITVGLTALLWVGWLTIPLLMVNDVRPLMGDAGYARMLTIHPVLLANAADTAAGDWTHQNVAYAHLTRLGQDLPLTWGGSEAGWWLYGLATIASLTVPRGTIVKACAAGIKASR